ncbi:hypothetical protein IM538_18605 [Cytobacillus suaedae]|nr:hypothetical protein IM538_18605 [Cytobacillus suaedae]
MKDKLFITFFIVFTIMVLLFTPIVTNKLMFIGGFKVSEGPNVWIGYLGSFWGAILGGIISGVITLLGVKLTIENQKRNEFINSYPRKRMFGDEISEKIHEFVTEISLIKGLNSNNKNKIAGLVKVFYYSLPDMIEKSIEIDGHVYSNLQNIKSIVDSMLKYIEANTSRDFYGDPDYELEVKEILRYQDLIVDCLSNHNYQIGELTNKFNKLTKYNLK